MNVLERLYSLAYFYSLRPQGAVSTAKSRLLGLRVRVKLCMCRAQPSRHCAQHHHLGFYRGRIEGGPGSLLGALCGWSFFVLREDTADVQGEGAEA